MNFIVILITNALISFNMSFTSVRYFGNDAPTASVISLMLIACIVLSLWQYRIAKSVGNTPSAVIIAMFSFCLISPIILLPFYSRFSLFDNFIQIIVLLFSIHIVIFLSSSPRKVPFVRGIYVNPDLFSFVLGGLLIVGALVLIKFFGDLMSLSWGDMYVRRIAAREILSQSSAVRYFNVAFAAVLIPFCALYGVTYRKWLIVALAFIGGILSFAAYGGKGVLFNPLLGVFLAIYFRHTNQKNSFIAITVLMLLFAGLCLIEISLTQTGFLNLYAFRRMFYVPAKLTFEYWEYFSTNPLYLMADSIFGGFFGGVPQDYSKSRLIGGVYYGDYRINANLNSFGTAFGDFGTLGMPLVAIFIGFFGRILNGIYAIKKSKIVIAYSIFIGLVWTQGGFHTSLLSNGIIYSLLILLLIPNEQMRVRKENSS